MAQRLANCRFLIRVILACFFLASMAASDISEQEALLNFKNSLSNDDHYKLSFWNSSISPCSGNTSNWSGLKCSNGAVSGLRLENMTLTGMINIDALTHLPSLRSLSLKNNSFQGPMSSVTKLGSLKALFLSYNNFSGEIPHDMFKRMKSLKKLYLERNLITGGIPAISGAASAKLLELNLSNNLLEGCIPSSLSKFNASSFAANKDLRGVCEPSKKKVNKTILISVIVAVIVVALAAIVAISYLRSRRSKTPHFKSTRETKALKYGGYHMGQKEVQSSDQWSNRQKVESGKLYFVRDDREKFELQDLLRASAEVLGSGSFGSSYKAVLLSGPAMVVKRFRQMSNLGREDFHDHMRRLGSLSHPNLLPLVAYYYRKEEKLLVSDFVPNGSLASHLHGRRAPGQAGLDWPTRLKIIKGVARGLAYLYREFPSLPLPHGHLKSSNVLLAQNYEPLLTDYALVPVVNKDHAQLCMVAYKSPEFNQSDRITRKTDIWSLGILILEMLTGLFPENYLKQGKGGNADLASWVNSVVREEWTGEVFDKDMKGTRNGEGEMLKLLKIGMCCCEWNAERRWDLREAVKKIEELKERDNDMDDYSSYASEEYGYSSKAMTDEDFSFSVNG